MAKLGQNRASSGQKASLPPHPSHPSPDSSGNATEKAEAAWKARKYPNPPDPFNPEPVALRDQWRFAIRQYSRWSSLAWGSAIFAGLSFFALGWYIKGSNPLAPAHEANNPAASSSETRDKM